MKKILFAAASALVLICCGCAPVETLTPSDLTLEQLEERMNKSMDPLGNYARSKTCVIRQEVEVPQFLDEPQVFMIETKMKRPDSFRITTYNNNEPIRVVCSDGKHGWTADYRDRKVSMLDGDRLKQMLILSRFSNPGGGYKNIFKKVDVAKCSNEDGNFYLITAVGENGSSFKIYVDPEEFFIRRIFGDMKVGSGTLDYDSRIGSYNRRDGVMIPQTTELTQNGQKQSSKVIFYQLDTVFPETEFLPPVLR